MKTRDQTTETSYHQTFTNKRQLLVTSTPVPSPKKLKVDHSDVDVIYVNQNFITAADESEEDSDFRPSPRIINLLNLLHSPKSSAANNAREKVKTVSNPPSVTAQNVAQVDNSPRHINVVREGRKNARSKVKTPKRNKRSEKPVQDPSPSSNEQEPVEQEIAQVVDSNIRTIKVIPVRPNNIKTPKKKRLASGPKRVEKSEKTKQPTRKSSPKKDKNKMKETCEKSDEGFDEDWDVIYTPKNEHYSLRKRRYMSPWWLKNVAKDVRYQIVASSSFTKEEEMALEEIKEIRKRTNKKIQQGALDFLSPLQELEKYKKMEAEMKAKVKRLSVQTKETQSNAIAKAFAKISCAEGEGEKVVKKTSAYEFSQMDGIEWKEESTGCYYSKFLNDSSDDALIKLLPGEIKQRANTQNRILKMIVLCGDVDFIINDSTVKIQKFGLININPGNSYEVHNSGNHDAIILAIS